MASFLDSVQLPQHCRVTRRKQFTFDHEVFKSHWHLFDLPQIDERQSHSWSNHTFILSQWKRIAIGRSSPYDHPLIKSSHAVCGEKFRVLLSVVIYRKIED